MKGLFVILFAAAAVITYVAGEVKLTEEAAKLVAKHREICKERSKVSQEVLDKTHRGNFPDTMEFLNHCLCVSKEMGFQDSKGAVQKDFVKMKAMNIFKDENVVRAIMHDCIHEHQDPSDLALHAFKCIYEQKGIMLL